MDDKQQPPEPGVRPAGKGPEAGKAQHGPRSEVTWDSGRGRQPYENQDAEVDATPGAEEFPEGNRGQSSGVNIQDLEKVHEKWRDSP